MTKFESDVKYVSQPVDALYARYSDLRNLETLREKLEDPAVQEKMAAQLTPEQIAQAKEQLQTMTSTATRSPSLATGEYHAAHHRARRTQVHQVCRRRYAHSRQCVDTAPAAWRG